ncbi:hypothetical protein Tco_1075096 [Tanacetum coccineum]
MIMEESYGNYTRVIRRIGENGSFNSLQNGPLVWTTVVEEDDTTRTKKYEELSVAEELHADCLAILVLSKEMIQLPVLTRQWLSCQLLQGSLQPTINLELPLIPETMPLFKMIGLLCNKFKGGKDKVMMVLAIRPKRPRNAAWLKDKEMLAEAQESGQILDEEQLAFIADPGIPDGQAAQTTIPNNVAFQTEDLDAYDYD